MYTHMYTHICVYIYIYLHVCIYIYIYIYLYTHLILITILAAPRADGRHVQGWGGAVMVDYMLGSAISLRCISVIVIGIAII